MAQTTLVTLVGEQPMPSLMAARTLRADETILVCTEQTRPVAERLKPLTEGRLLLLNEAYQIDKIAATLRQQLGADLSGTTFDITGGTKAMSLAAYGLAAEGERPAVYVRTTGRHPDVSVYDAARSVLSDTLVVPKEAFTLDEYLRAYVGSYDEDGPAKGDDGQVNEGGRFELAVAQALGASCDEVLIGVKPGRLGRQVDLDLVIRRGPRVGVVECKLARDGRVERPKQGLDQLMQATDRVAFGTHVVRILVTGAPLNKSIGPLVDDRSRRVTHVWVAYRDGKALAPQSGKILRDHVRQAFDHS